MKTFIDSKITKNNRIKDMVNIFMLENAKFIDPVII